VFVFHNSEEFQGYNLAASNRTPRPFQERSGGFSIFIVVPIFIFLRFFNG
jgi:hypothetical protein